MNSCFSAALGDISIGIKCAPGVVGPGEADIDFDIIKNDNDTFTVKYTPPAAGRYTIMVLFAEQVKMHLQLFLFFSNCGYVSSDVLNWRSLVTSTGNPHQSVQGQSGSITRRWQSESRGSRTQQDR